MRAEHTPVSRRRAPLLGHSIALRSYGRCAWNSRSPACTTSRWSARVATWSTNVASMATNWKAQVPAIASPAVVSGGTIGVPGPIRRTTACCRIGESAPGTASPAASTSSPIGLAYLLARTTDTIADTDLVALEQRLEALRQLRERIQGQIGRASCRE